MAKFNSTQPGGSWSRVIYLEAGIFSSESEKVKPVRGG